MAAQKQGAARGTAVLRCVGCLQLPPTVDTHALRISYPPHVVDAGPNKPCYLCGKQGHSTMTCPFRCCASCFGLLEHHIKQTSPAKHLLASCVESFS